MSGRPQRAQGVVEYALIIAAAAIVSIAGLNAMTQAQAAYWGAATPTFASPTPSTGTFTHATKVTIGGPNCDPAVTYIAGSANVALSTVNCIATVQDISPDLAERTPPQGTLQLQLDAGIALTCSTAAATLAPSGVDKSSCPVWTHAWTRAEADQNNASNPHALQASYTATSNHQPGSTVAPLMMSVVPVLNVKVACHNPIFPAPPNAATWNTTTEVGHPLICSPTLLDPMNGPNTPYVSPIPATVSLASAAGGGVPTFGCFTNNSYPAFASCSAPSPTLACTITSGTWNARCATFIYRRDYDDGLGVLGPPNILNCQPGASVPDGCWNDAFTFSVVSLGQSFSSPITITTPNETLGIDRGHPTGTFVQCTPAPNVDFGDDPGSAVLARDWIMKGTSAQLSRAGQAWATTTYRTAHKIEDPVSQPPITCTAFVLDGDPSAVFDTSGCVHAAPYCNPDASDAHTPLGKVQFQDTTTNTVYGQCLLAHAISRPSYLNALPTGQPEYASWCQVTFNTLPGNTLPLNTTMRAQYRQEPSAPGSLPTPAHTASYSPDIVVDFQ